MDFVLCVVLAQAVVAAPTPVPVVKAGTGATRTLSDVARERKLGVRGVPGGKLSAAESSSPSDANMPSGRASDNPAAPYEKEASGAQGQQDRAIRDGIWTERNIHYNEAIKEQARRDWDSAAESCRKTPGCVPVYRENTTVDGVKPLRTGEEQIRDLRKDRGTSAEAPPQAGANGTAR